MNKLHPIFEAALAPFFPKVSEHQTVKYQCGCEASGPGPLPNYCPEHECSECRGTGQVSYERSGQDSDGNAPIVERCPVCGYGHQYECLNCGDEFVSQERIALNPWCPKCLDRLTGKSSDEPFADAAPCQPGCTAPTLGDCIRDGRPCLDDSASKTKGDDNGTAKG